MRQLKFTAMYEGVVAGLSGVYKNWLLLSNFASVPPLLTAPLVCGSAYVLQCVQAAGAALLGA